MLPLYLSIKGLYSYQSKQEIDFTKLTEAGLFGIFGKVGSGKSSILEAISMALYGETERLNKSDSRGYNMLNLKSDAAEIVFEFLNFNAKKYRFVVSWKRKKKYNETDPISRKAYVWHTEQWLPLDTFEGQEIVGLSYENFKRTIIIPQGQFKEFLELKETERSNMMMQIFGLQRYNLHDKAKALLNQNQASIDQLSGQLSTYEEVSEEMIQATEASYQALLEQSNTERVSLTEKQTAFEKLDALRKQTALFKLRKSEYDQLLQQEAAQHEKQILITEFTKAYELFNTDFSLRKTSESKLNNSKAELQSKEADFKLLEQECHKISIELNRLNEELKNVPAMEQSLRDFETLLDLKDKWTEKELAQANQAKFQDQVVKGQAVFETQEAELLLVRNTLQTLKAQKRDSEWLVAVAGWYQQNDMLSNQLHLVQTELTELESKRNQLQQELESKGCSKDNFEAYYEERISSLKANITTKETLLSELRVKAALADFATHLHDGAACPLCGSLEHPEIISDSESAKAIAQIEVEILALNSQLDHLYKEKQHATQLVFQLNELSKTQNSKSELSATLQLNIQEHQGAFTWEELQADDKSKFEQIKQQDLAVSNDLKVAESKESALLVSFEETKRNFDLVKTKLEEAKVKLAEKLAACQTLEAKLSKEVLAEAVQQSVQELQQKGESLRNTIQSIRLRQENESRNFNEKSISKSALEGQIAQLLVLIQNEETSLQSIQASIQKSLTQSDFQNEAAVAALLARANEISSWREAVDKYFNDLKSLKAVLTELEAQLEGAVFDEAAFVQLEQAYNEAKSSFELLLNELGKTNGQLQELKKRFVEKGDLHARMNGLESRHQLIEKLVNLFKGNGFVNYVSSIYLEQLAAAANLRFHRLTRNQLSLRVNDKGDFEIIDYLNDGASRSVKTLSGGQSFQASLCLALALAESVQSAYQQEKNFFFIDEGFGTQDEESTNMVYETLQSLVKENRIVGIISHVGELQERIPKSVLVQKDESLGSQLIVA
ncbi:MAG: SMC family ATPase [Chitinophagales bacterium]|nr:SMC family ATPase [Chitinophagales bacterium]